MNRVAKYLLIAFISFNVLGGTILGLREYRENLEAREAFKNFYYPNTQVMGAYDKKPSKNISFYVAVGAIEIFAALAGAGAAHLLMARRFKNKD